MMDFTMASILGKCMPFIQWWEGNMELSDLNIILVDIFW